MISVIMPCTLEEYDGGAKNRKQKLDRAIKSFLAQEFESKELVVIADGDFETIKFISENYHEHENIRAFLISKQEPFSGNVRDFGLKRANGTIIAYLDSDDFLKESNHLKKIAEAFKHQPYADWVYFDDYVKYFELDHLPLAPREAKLTYGNIGVSNIAHRNFKSITWSGCDQYGHDWSFIQRLITQYPTYKKIDGTSYVVCHIHNSVDT